MSIPYKTKGTRISKTNSSVIEIQQNFMIGKYDFVYSPHRALQWIQNKTIYIFG